MKAYKTEFLELALELGVLRFGEFTLKSGRVSPYFFNAGLFNSGYAAAKLGRCYASAVAALDLEFDMLFGPAYKAIPIVALAAAALAEHHDEDYPFAFNRKEEKDHGEGGMIDRRPARRPRADIGRRDHGWHGHPRGARSGPRGGRRLRRACSWRSIAKRWGRRTGYLAVQQLEAELGVPIRSIVSLSDLIDHLEEDKDFAEHLPAVRAYRNRYGVAL